MPYGVSIRSLILQPGQASAPRAQPRPQRRSQSSPGLTSPACRQIPSVTSSSLCAVGLESVGCQARANLKNVYRLIQHTLPIYIFECPINNLETTVSGKMQRPLCLQPLWVSGPVWVELGSLWVSLWVVLGRRFSKKYVFKKLDFPKLDLF